MTVTETLERLSAEDAVFLSRWLLGLGLGSTTVYRGKLCQAPDGDWHFLHESTGHRCGLVAIELGSVDGPLDWRVEGDNVQIVHTLLVSADPDGGPPKALMDVMQLGTTAAVREPFSS